MTVDKACANRLPSLKFVGDSDTLSVSPLIGNPLNSNLVRVIACGVGNLLNSIGVLGTFHSWLMEVMGQHLSDGPRDLATFTFNLGARDTCQWYGSSYTSSVYQVWSSLAFPFGRYDTLFISALIRMITLVFDNVTLKLLRLIVGYIAPDLQKVLLFILLLSLSPLLRLAYGTMVYGFVICYLFN